MSPEEKRYLVSIITVTKNCGPTIARTLESIRSVKSRDIQYVIIDGESTDGPLDIIRGHGDLVRADGRAPVEAHGRGGRRPPPGDRREGVGLTGEHGRAPDLQDAGGDVDDARAEA